MTIEILTEKVYTLQEFFELGLDENYELIEGKLLAKSDDRRGKSAEHHRVIAKLGYYLLNYLETNPIAEVYEQGPTTLGSSDPKASSVEPDISVVLLARLPADWTGLNSPLPVAPDIAVEVWSPSDDTEKIESRVKLFEKAGVQLVWSIYLLAQHAIVHELGNSKKKFINFDEELDGGSVLPGFKLPLNELFKRIHAGNNS